MQYLVLVTPDDDEATLVDRTRALSALDWLKARQHDGTIVYAAAYPQTGGVAIVDVSDRVALEELWSTYPLRHTITMRISELVTLDEGFGVLLANIDAAMVRT